MPMPALSFILIITYGRSGSTATQNLLNALPGWCIRGENANAAYGLCRSIARLQDEANIDIRREAATLPPADRKPRMQEIMGKPADPWFGAEGIDIEAYAAALSDAFVQTILRPPAGTRVTGFKEIRMQNDRGFSERYLETVRMLLPGVRFVFQKRDHEELMKSGWWPKKDPIESRQGFEFADALFDRYTEAHPDRAHILHYDQIRSGAAALRPLFSFLGEEMQAEQIDAVLAEQLSHSRG